VNTLIQETFSIQSSISCLRPGNFFYAEHWVGNFAIMGKVTGKVKKWRYQIPYGFWWRFKNCFFSPQRLKSRSILFQIFRFVLTYGISAG